MNMRDMLGFCGDPNCEEHWRECSMCGVEFCGKCFPRSRFCPTCVEEVALGDDEEDEDPDFVDLPNVDGEFAELYDERDEEAPLY